ncbi:PilZ domain-containing protein [Bacillus sp. EB01]|uniref:PilZ domain-containing protein n=1 Tax=Bacillus sp. EB01 TaxID=1347086 RepID=UPI0005C57EDE|nr:PilZ domain-containing protein [Bacillus sp. EB01]
MHANLISRRQFKRVAFQEPVKTVMKLATLPADYKLNKEENIDIYVIDISAGGLRIASKRNLDINYLTVYKIPFELSGKNVILYGKIVRKRALINDFYEYGVSFSHFFNHEQGIVD